MVDKKTLFFDVGCVILHNPPPSNHNLIEGSTKEWFVLMPEIFIREALQFITRWKMLSRKIFFQFYEQKEITWCDVWRIRWMRQLHEAIFLNRLLRKCSSVNWRLINQQPNWNNRLSFQLLALANNLTKMFRGLRLEHLVGASLICVRFSTHASAGREGKGVGVLDLIGVKNWSVNTLSCEAKREWICILLKVSSADFPSRK